MGIHLHKAIGWAVPCSEDPLDRDSKRAQRTLAAHGAWLRFKASHVADEEARDEVLFEADLLAGSGSILLSQCIVHIPQLDSGTLLVIPPVYLQAWARMDDDLDCAFAEDETVENRIKYTRANPFGFDHLWMDAVNGRALSGPVRDAVARRGEDRGDQAAMRVRYRGGKAPAFSDPVEAAGRIVPGVPREVKHLIEHLDNFLEPQTLLGLRPARAVWMG